MTVQRLEARREERLDKVLAGSLPYSRTRLQAWIEAGRVRVDEDTVTTKSERVNPGQHVEVDVPPRETREGVVPESGSLEVIHEDEAFLAVEKPSGTLVHPTASERTGTLVNRLLFHYPELSEVGEPHRAGLVHRLDRPTSGVLLVARTESALRTLKDQFRRRRVKKTYRAVLEGDLRDGSVEVQVPLGRHPDNPVLRRADPSGKYARTEIERVGGDGTRTAVYCYPETGRTHQIRIHARYIGHPVLGDAKYGSGGDERLMLHAESLRFEHPRTSEPITVRSPRSGEALPVWEELVSG